MARECSIQKPRNILLYNQFFFSLLKCKWTRYLSVSNQNLERILLWLLLLVEAKTWDSTKYQRGIQLKHIQWIHPTTIDENQQHTHTQTHWRLIFIKSNKTPSQWVCASATVSCKLYYGIRWYKSEQRWPLILLLRSFFFFGCALESTTYYVPIKATKWEVYVSLINSWITKKKKTKMKEHIKIVDES